MNNTDISTIRNLFNEGITELVLPKFDMTYQQLDTIGQRLDHIEADLADTRKIIISDQARRIERVEQDLAHLKPRQ